MADDIRDRSLEVLPDIEDRVYDVLDEEDEMSVNEQPDDQSSRAWQDLDQTKDATISRGRSR